MKLKKLFALALAVCMMALAVPAAFAASLTLDYGTTPTTPVVEEQTPVVYNTRTTSRATTALRSDELAAIEAIDADPDKLSINKKVDSAFTPNAENAPYYKIDLSAKAKSNIVVQTQAKAIDVILVLDRSGNMNANAMSDLIKAINGDGTDENKGFLANVKATAKDSRVAVVTYAGQGASKVISGTKDISNGAFVKLSEEAKYEALRQEIRGLTAISGADAYSNEGFANAAKLFQSVPSNDGNYGNPRIVVFFTAGIPGVYDAGWEYYTGNGRSAVYPAYNIAQESIHWSRILKEGKGDNVNPDLSQEFWTWEGWFGIGDKGDSRTPESVFYVANKYDYRIGCGATVYCIGLSLPKCEQNNHDEDGCSGTRVNEYLYRISSHRPDGSHVGSRNKYNPWEEETNYDWGSTYKDYYTRNISSTFGEKYPEEAAISYYQVGTTVDGISDMFEKIDVNVEQNQPITDVTVRDYLAPGFVPCDDQGTPLRDGDTFAGGTVVKDGDVYYIEWEEITLNPSDPAATASIYVKPVDDYYGGNGVQTNIYGPSGLYSGDTLFASFPDCRTNVPVKAIDPAVQHQTVYLSNTADLLKLRESSIDSTLNGKNNVGVIVTYELKDGTNTIATYEIAKGATSGVWKRNADGEVITSWPVTPTECASYTLTCTVDGGTGNVSDPKSATATVHVVKPTITNSDTTVYLSNSIDLNTQMQEAAAWTCSHSGISLPVTEDSARVAPVVDYTFAGVADETAYAPDACTDITVSATVGTNETPFALADNSFKVHVLKPTVVAEEKTIWQSESVTSTATVTGWNCACTDVTHTMHKNSAKPDETIEMPSVTPEDCTKYTATYTVGDTDFTADYWVHVLTADLSMSDPVIYLSQTVTFDDHDTVTWETQCEHGKSLTSDAPTASAVVDGEASAAPKTCMDYKADLKIGRTVYTKDIPFTVHVVCPAVTATDATIKLGNKAPETGHVDWEMESGVLTSGKFICECDDHHNANAMPNTEPVLSVQHTGAEYPTACSNNGHKATALIDGVLWTDYCANYTVHVQTPEVTGKTDTIYQGQDYDLTSTVTWKKCAHDKALTNESEQDPAATTTYQIKNSEGSFIDAGTKANYDACSDYKVTYQLTNVPNSFTGEFTVHVLIPTFTVETQDLWADLGTNVTLFRAAATDVDAVKSCGSSWIYSGANCGHQNPPAAADLPAGAPDVAVTKVAFNEGEAAAIKEQDVSVTANAVTYTVNEKTYTAGNDRLTGSLIAKLHANTFILKVVNSSAQNGIFTLKQGNTALYDVAVPGNSDTTTIAGLYCTKPYNLDETTGNAWSWRYNTAVKSGSASHSNPDIVATKNCDAVVEVTVDYGTTQDNPKWLADEDCVVNKATTQATITNPALSVKKKDEEVTNV